LVGAVTVAIAMPSIGLGPVGKVAKAARVTVEPSTKPDRPVGSKPLPRHGLPASVAVNQVPGAEWVKTSHGPAPRAHPSQFSMEGKVFHVTKVVDGDTAHLGELPNHAKVRFLGVDTPETKHVVKGIQFWGPEASQFTKKLLTDVDVVVHVDPKNQYGVFGRSLVYLELMDGRDFNAMLIRGGYARVTREYKFSRMKEYVALESKAKAAGLGMWNKQGRLAFDARKRAAAQAASDRLEELRRQEEARRRAQIEGAVKGGGRYISSTTSKSVHEPWCPRRPKKRVRHIKTLEEALKQGLKKHRCFRK